jgi:murein DD-endopeptidase MepM/ murein hydrolase activator NlpD
MAIDPLFHVESRFPAIGGSASPARRVSDPTPDKIATLSQEFEAMLVLQMIKQMRQSMLAPEEEDLGLGAETMTETVDVELARHLSQQGGIGLAKVMQEAFARQSDADPGAAPAASPTAAAAPDLLGAVSGNTVKPDVTMPLAAPVSSPFGWRTDPLDGTRRFHSGVDLPAAYGHAVPAAAQGRVVSAGDQGGYGLTVVVEHPGGLQSRYAHLSSYEVKPGDQVQAGQVIGRVGQTGRATGPHLHFELVREGRRLDPATVAAERTLALKVGGPDADLENGQEPARAAWGDIYED